MKLIRPTDRPVSNSDGSVRHPYTRHEWFREWLANQGEFVLLNCGCKEDLNYKGLLIIMAAFQRVDIFCERHNRFTEIKKKISFFDYCGLPKPESPAEPLF